MANLIDGIALVSGEKSNFQYILRLLNTNVDGKQKIMVALTEIKGVGRRYSNLVCKKADVDLTKRYVGIIYFNRGKRREGQFANPLFLGYGFTERENSQPKNSNES